MGRVIARGWIDEATVRAALEDACRANGIWKDDGAKACRDAITRGIRAGLANQHEDLAERAPSPEDEEAERIGAALASGNLARYGGAEPPQPPDGPTGAAPEEVLGKASSANNDGQGDVKGDASGDSQAKSAPLIKATPYSWPECSSIPPREWLYGHHLIRGFVAVTGSPGGVGKSSLLFAEAASMVSGRALLHDVAPVMPLNVWIWNGEDPLVELNRRVAATMKHFGIKPQNCHGRLFLDSGRDTKIVVAEVQKGGTVIVRPIVDAIKATIKDHKIDVVVIDPFVSSHRLPENDNNAMDAIVREWSDIADQTGCAIELVHHVRKTGDFEISVEALRGGSALVSAARSVRVLNQMSSDEADKTGVENRRLYFRVNNGKSNMAPSSEKGTWFHMHSVDLANRGPYQDGDSIGVVTEWEWPDPLVDVTADDLQAVLQRVGSGQWRENSQAKNDWVGLAVAEVLGLDPSDKQAKEKIKGLLKIWIKNGALVVVRRPDKNGDERPFVEIGKGHSDGA
ncbi:AAA family ATPase [Methylocystis parvus]|uniref:AAA family ATPase n=2 Tax=Methylocystis parvus TaxID=134 RepID=A0A6B8MAH0_9HYPH|nr:AAA family ATPase [Methylocystis parvus]